MVFFCLKTIDKEQDKSYYNRGQGKSLTLKRIGDIMIENVLEMNTLLDFYGKLLSYKQYRAMEMYYFYDYSLNEIAEDLDISKQAVSDNLKRAESNLKEFNEKLQLISSYEKRKSNREQLKSLLDLLEKKSKDIDIDTLNKLKTIINEEVY